jgi:hypothetical protein
VNLRRLGWAALFGLSFLPAQSLLATEPARLGLSSATPIPVSQPMDAQALADTIAAALRHSGTLRDYSVDVCVRAGAVELTGRVTDQGQREEVLRLAQGVPGVGRVIDRLTLTRPAVALARLREGPDVPGKLPEPLPPPSSNDRRAPGACPDGGAGAGAGNDKGKGNGNGNGIPEPTPIFRAPMPSYYAQNPPAMPPYSWSTYAPYNNYSRVAYPLAYPYKSWPFIGPCYPFPKVPLGWRAVKLQFDDGYWWYSRVGHKYDWWKIRYW